MLKKLETAEDHLDFITELTADPAFSDPMLSSEEQMRGNLLDAPAKPGHQLWGVYEEGRLSGLFVFLILEDEAYMEMIVGLSRSPEAYREMLAFLKEKYPGFQADFVYNPGNHVLSALLRDENAEFEPEQQKMVLQKDVPHRSSHQIEEYRPQYREQYITLHAQDCYWTAPKVIDAPDRFRILLAIEDGEVVGYIDVTHKYAENELFDVFVKPSHRRRGYGKAMLARALELNKPKGMMLLVDVDNAAAIAMCESLGFRKVDGANNLTAHVQW